LLFVLAGGSLFVIVSQTAKIGWQKASLLPCLLVVLATGVGISHSRLISLCPSLIMAGLAEHFYRASKSDSKANLEIRENWLQSQLKDRTSPAWLFQSFNLCLIFIGALFITNVIPPTLPQSSLGFQAPFKAITYLQTHRPIGRLLNDPQFGSVMSWYLKNPDVFIDTRFSMFEEQRVLDYHLLSLAQPGWQNILSKYKFDWAFLPPAQPLAICLEKSGWKPLYRDAQSVILTKP
jgi:hypothetical protein